MHKKKKQKTFQKMEPGSKHGKQKCKAAVQQAKKNPLWHMAQKSNPGLLQTDKILSES